MIKKKKNELNKGEVVIYKSRQGKTELEVSLKDDTVWLTQKQMSELFQKNVRTINEHVKNIYAEGELGEGSTIRKFRIVQKEGTRTVNRNVDFYNLDVIISVGYRVKSLRGTQFRIWANKVLKDYLVKGYALNEKRLKEQKDRVKELEQTLEIFTGVVDNYKLGQDEFSGILKVVKDYTYALDILDGYDHQNLKINGTNKKETFKISYESAKSVITEMKKKFGGSDLFGKEKDQSFKSSINSIYQTFGKKELYPSVEEKAAHLLYFIVKNHSFVDGNKRIAAAVFLWFLEMNNYLYNKKGTKRIADNALVGLCLLAAESKPADKEMIVKVIVNLINMRN
jgi:prophage maintenance system killer protein